MGLIPSVWTQTNWKNPDQLLWEHPHMGKLKWELCFWVFLKHHWILISAFLYVDILGEEHLFSEHLIYSVDVLGEEHNFLEKNISRCSWRRTSHTFSGGAEGPRLGPEVDPCPKCSCIVLPGYNIWTPGLGLSSPFAPKSPLQICKYMVQPGDHLPWDHIPTNRTRHVPQIMTHLCTPVLWNKYYCLVFKPDSYSLRYWPCIALTVVR